MRSDVAIWLCDLIPTTSHTSVDLKLQRLQSLIKVNVIVTAGTRMRGSQNDHHRDHAAGTVVYCLLSAAYLAKRAVGSGHVAAVQSAHVPHGVQYAAHVGGAQRPHDDHHLAHQAGTQPLGLQEGSRSMVVK